MDWNPVCIFDEEPDWKRLGALHPDACLVGYQHRTRKLWALDGGIDDLPAELRYEFPLSWPVDFEIPCGLSISTAHSDFIDKVGTSGLIAHLFEPGRVRFGVAVVSLAGVRTYLYPGICDPSFNFACVLNSYTVEGFGVSGGSLELEWVDSTVGIRRVTCAGIPDTGADDESLDRLRDLPFVELQLRAGPEIPSPSYWPERLWPTEWGDPAEIAGIGRTIGDFAWFREWKYCYQRPSRNAPGTIASLFEMVFRQPFATTRMARFFRANRGDESSDENY